MFRRATAPLVVLALVLASALAPTGVANAAVDHPINATFWYHISVRISGKYVDVKKSSTKDGTALQQYSSNDHKSQQFRFVAQDDGYYQIVSKADSKNDVNYKPQSWDVTDESTADGTKVETWHWKEGTNQQWRAVEEVDGYISFRPLNASSSCLTVPKGSKSNSVQFVISHCIGSKSQQFKLHKGSKAIAGACKGEVMTRPTVLGVILPVCGPRPGLGGGPDVYAYPGAVSNPGYQCAELSVRWLYHKWNIQVNGDGAAIVGNAHAAAPTKFTVYENGRKNHAPKPGDVISLSANSSFSDAGHTGVVRTSTVDKNGNGTIIVAEQNFGVAEDGTLLAQGSDGWHVYQVKKWYVQWSLLPHIHWLHRK